MIKVHSWYLYDWSIGAEIMKNPPQMVERVCAGEDIFQGPSDGGNKEQSLLILQVLRVDEP